MGIVDFLFKSEKQRQVKKLGVIADKIEALEPKYAAMSDDELRRQTELFRFRETSSFPVPFPSTGSRLKPLQAE